MKLKAGQTVEVDLAVFSASPKPRGVYVRCRVAHVNEIGQAYVLRLAEDGTVLDSLYTPADGTGEWVREVKE